MLSRSSGSLDHRVPSFANDIRRLKISGPISMSQNGSHLLHQGNLNLLSSMAMVVNKTLEGNAAHHNSSEEESTQDSNHSTGSSPPFPGYHRQTPQPKLLEHVIRLSSIDHCMPRAYIRVCLAFRLPDVDAEAKALSNLKCFVRRLVDAKPYLSGYVVAAQEPSPQKGKVEIRFTLDDFDSFPDLQVRRYSHEEMPFTYTEIDAAGLPPSVIKPDLVSALPESADESRAPVLRVQANVVQGGLIVSFYLHHCISDGTGLGLLISGKILDDDFTFEPPLRSTTTEQATMVQRLAIFAEQKTQVREQLSKSTPNRLNDRYIQYKLIKLTKHPPSPTNQHGRGCIFTFSDSKVDELKKSLESVSPGSFLTKTDALESFIWHHMTVARLPSLSGFSSVNTSKLLIPVNIRSKTKPLPLAQHYFGSAVDFASTELAIQHLLDTDTQALATTAMAIRKSINAIDDAYIRSAISLANSTDPTVDVRDLQASNMNRVTAADMYITSWEEMPLYNADLGLGLGMPDWVRKPWSRDPGSCIILPKDPRKSMLEVVVQMTEADMGRLLMDQRFMAATARAIIE